MRYSVLIKSDTQVPPYWYMRLMEDIFPFMPEIPKAHRDSFLDYFGSLEDAHAIWKISGYSLEPRKILRRENYKYLGGHYIWREVATHCYTKNKLDQYEINIITAWAHIKPLWEKYQDHLHTMNINNPGVVCEF